MCIVSFVSVCYQTIYKAIYNVVYFLTNFHGSSRTLDLKVGTLPRPRKWETKACAINICPLLSMHPQPQSLLNVDPFRIGNSLRYVSHSRLIKSTLKPSKPSSSPSPIYRTIQTNHRRFVVNRNLPPIGFGMLQRQFQVRWCQTTDFRAFCGSTFLKARLEIPSRSLSSVSFLQCVSLSGKEQSCAEWFLPYLTLFHIESSRVFTFPSTSRPFSSSRRLLEDVDGELELLKLIFGKKRSLFIICVFIVVVQIFS